MGERRSARVTVGIPVWNGERFIGEAIESVLGQSFGELVLLVCDNASTDATEDICRAYARGDARVLYERNATNLGAAPNFNRCFEAAATEYFKWHSSDDIMSTDYLAQCIAMLDSAPDVVLAFAPTVYVDELGSPIGTQLAADLSLRSSDPSRRVGELLRHARNAPDIYWAIYGVARSSSIAATKLHGSYIASDQVYLFELALQGKLMQVAGPTFFSRTHPGTWRSAERDAERDTEWFDSSSTSRLVLPHWTLFGHHYAAVARARLPALVKARCAAAVSRRAVVEWRNLGGDAKIALRRMGRVRSDNDGAKPGGAR